MPPSRPSPYRRVEVRALTWEGHNSQKAQGPVYNADQELRMILDSFNSYGYNVVSRKIPMNPERRDGFHRGFENELANLGRQPGAVLVIVYYQGHGHADRQNRLLLSNGNGQSMHWSHIANAIIKAPCDVLSILNCCHAGASLASAVPSRPNYENHIKQIMMAAPAGEKSHWGSAAGFAACLEETLREHREDWEITFKGIPDHWAESINRRMVKRSRPGQVGVRFLIKPPPRVNTEPIVLGPYKGR